MIKINDFGFSILDKKQYAENDFIIIDDPYQDWFDILIDIMNSCITFMRIGKNYIEYSNEDKKTFFQKIKNIFFKDQDKLKENQKKLEFIKKLEETFIPKYFSTFFDYESVKKLVDNSLFRSGYPNNELFDKNIKKIVKLKSDKEIFNYFSDIFEPREKHIIIEKYNFINK